MKQQPSVSVKLGCPQCHMLLIVNSQMISCSNKACDYRITLAEIIDKALRGYIVAQRG